MAWLAGEWRCSSYAGNATISRYVRESPSRLTHKISFVSRIVAPIIETYQYDAYGDRFTLTDNFGFAGTAGPWIGKTWTFSGFSVRGRAVGPETLTYIYVNEGSFRRDIRSWSHDSASVCTRY